MSFKIPETKEAETRKGVLIKMPISLYERLRRTCEVNQVTMQLMVEEMVDHCLKEIEKGN